MTYDLEEHTMTVMINQKDKKIENADSFYHDAYKFDSGSFVANAETAKAKPVSFRQWKKGETWDKPITINAFDTDLKVKTYDPINKKETETPIMISTVGYASTQLERTRENVGFAGTRSYFGVEQNPADEEAILLNAASPERGEQLARLQGYQKPETK